LDDPARRDAQAELIEQPCGLSRRHAQPLGKPRRQRHRAGTQLRARRPQRVGSLRRVAGLDPQAARAAAADVNLEPDSQRARLGQILDMLDRDPLQDQLAAAAGAASWQPDGDDWSTRSGGCRCACLPWAAPDLRPARLGLGLGSPLENGAA
jgi:hypothetical protein